MPSGYIPLYLALFRAHIAEDSDTRTRAYFCINLDNLLIIVAIKETTLLSFTLSAAFKKRLESFSLDWGHIVYVWVCVVSGVGRC